MEKKIRKIKTAKGLVLAMAIVSCVLIFPMLGYLFNVFTAGVMSLLVLALAIITLVFCIRARVEKIGAIIAVITSSISFVSGVLMFIGFLELAGNVNALDATDIAIQMTAGGQASLFFIGFLIGFLAWFLFIISAVFLFLDFSRIRKLQKEMELEIYQPINYSSDASEAISKFNQSDYQLPDFNAEYGQEKDSDTEENK